MVKPYKLFDISDTFDEDYDELTTCFDQIRGKLVTTINSTWTKERKEKAFIALDKGKAILESQDHLDRYLFSYGKMHQAKLNQAFSTIKVLTSIKSNEVGQAPPIYVNDASGAQCGILNLHSSIKQFWGRISVQKLQDMQESLFLNHHEEGITVCRNLPNKVMHVAWLNGAQDEKDSFVEKFGKEDLFFSAPATVLHDIQLIDYGCGQGIGSIVFCDYLTNSTDSEIVNISNIKLVEPSEIALNQAKNYLIEYFSDPTIQLINKTIEQLDTSDLATDEQSVKFHIFSNILDIEYFNLANLFQVIKKSQRGQNYFICVSPDYPAANRRLDDFINYFKNNTDCFVISERKCQIKNSKNPSKPWMV